MDVSYVVTYIAYLPRLIQPMIKSLSGESRHHFRKKKTFTPVYTAMLLLSLHWALVLYVNSTYLKLFAETSTINSFFIIGSLVTTVSLFFLARALNAFGNYKITVALGILELLTLVGIAYSTIPFLVILLFIIHQAIVPLLLFNVDIFVESTAGSNEEGTGRTRGVLAGIMIGNDTPHFSLVYLVSAFFMIPFLFVVHRYFANFKDPPYAGLKLKALFNSCWKNTNLRFVFLAHLLLQLFFAWMVIYVPVYLATEIGFGWEDIGLILFVGMLAYVLLEYPVGLIADLYTGEKELMAIGFFILAITTCWISFLEAAVIVPWVVMMFMTRVGASMVEATTESYFFKHATGENASVIGLFRITRPLAIILGALFGGILLTLLPIQYIFIPFGLFLILGAVFSFFLVDTK
jgi:hypothetical protein